MHEPDEEEAGIIELIISIVRNKLNSKDDDDDLKSEDGDQKGKEAKGKKKEQKKDVFKRVEELFKNMFKELDILNEDGEGSDDDEKEERF